MESAACDCGRRARPWARSSRSRPRLAASPPTPRVSPPSSRAASRSRSPGARVFLWFRLDKSRTRVKLRGADALLRTRARREREREMEMEMEMERWRRPQSLVCARLCLERRRLERVRSRRWWRRALYTESGCWVLFTASNERCAVCKFLLDFEFWVSTGSLGFGRWSVCWKARADQRGSRGTYRIVQLGML